MTVNPADIAVELGIAAPSQSDSDRWQTWINQATYLIGKRLTVADLDPADVDYVVLQAVAAHVRNPDDATQVSVAIDDANMSRTYRSSAGRVVITDDLWALLDPDLQDSGAFSVTPAFLPDCPLAWP